LISALAHKNRLSICAGFWEGGGEDLYSTLILADRTGQLDARTWKLNFKDGGNGLGRGMISAIIQGKRCAFALADDLYEDSLIDLLKALRVQVLVIPSYLVALEEELGGIVKGTMPASIAELIERARSTALKAGVHVVSVNSFSDENGPCGGGFIVDPNGESAVELPFFDDSPVEYTIP
jgi:predicted amidohydrolase